MAITYKPGGITLTIGKQAEVSLPPRVFRARLSALHFDTDKSFLLPMSISGVKAVTKYYDEHPGLTVLVNGHTDLVGTPEHNLTLSDERAKAVAAYLTNDVDAWLPWYDTSDYSKRWSYLEDQHMLATVAAPDGKPYYAGPISGANDAATQAAVKRFQTDNGLKADGLLGPKTRRALIGKYMDLDGTTLPADAKLEMHGCGEYHPVDATTGSDLGNRRVEIFLFEGPVDPAAPAKCPGPSGCTQYGEWVKRTVETRDVGHGDDLVVRVEDSASPPNPIAKAEVTVSAAGIPAQLTDDKGLTTFLGLNPGPVHVVAKAGGAIGQRDAVVGGGASDAPEPAAGAKSLAGAGGDAKAAAGTTGDPVVVPVNSPRLRLSLFDFNPSFVKNVTATTCDLDTALLDQFKAARIDDYSLVHTIKFNGANPSNDANPPVWEGLAPWGSTAEAVRIDYLQKLTKEMQNRGAQVIAGYEMVDPAKEKPKPNESDEEKAKREKREQARQQKLAKNALFRQWLAAATAAQVKAHAADIVAFFQSRQILVDGIGFDFEMNGFGKAHATNAAALFNETANAFAAWRPGSLVYYDTAPFQPNDGQGSSSIMAVLTYALANGASNLIARPMCYNGSVTSASGLKATIDCALRPTTSGGGGLGPSHVQYAIDVSRTPDATVKSHCTTLFRPNLVGMTIYTMPGTGAQKGFLAKATGWEKALNPGLPPPGTTGQPLQVPKP